ncbi:pseudouridylate synthase I [Terriglobus roseus DSM 18391]|uniref:tRNA pseudouridine synthase A n=1 Tax=Terriglobus roseus (strain DSM 18391 / NRRL B-41598 / KBS 63) TaxID=926566 RepID=I3ZF19_TERRK|nr:tRNA pseudouridine(38-40) synthase TruA [Terriglobus roseus]AFL87837.1 pseudouridylate synthase I [Terriglobus roseus DSM 18391]
MFPSDREHSGQNSDAGTPPNAPPARTYRLSIAYDGTDFFGWQVQPGLPTIQGSLATAVREVTGETVLPQGSGRTDTGVHASAQAVSLNLQANIPADRLLRALNRRLPASIRIVSLVDAPPHFHARAGVLDKTYEYRIFQRRLATQPNEQICLPDIARYVWDCRWPLSLDPMQRAAEAFVGTHDFTSFAATDPDRTQRLQDEGDPVDNVRTSFQSGWQLRDGLLVYRVTGSGFLHHMVRNIVGTCVEIGAGRMPADAIPAILAAHDRRQAGATAPPQGLHLVEVNYLADQTASHDKTAAKASA